MTFCPNGVIMKDRRKVCMEKEMHKGVLFNDDPRKP